MPKYLTKEKIYTFLNHPDLGVEMIITDISERIFLKRGLQILGLIDQEGMKYLRDNNINYNIYIDYHQGNSAYIISSKLESLQKYFQISDNSK